MLINYNSQYLIALSYRTIEALVEIFLLVVLAIVLILIALLLGICFWLAILATLPFLAIVAIAKPL